MAILRFFSQKGRQVVPMEVKYGVELLLHAKFHPHGAEWGYDRDPEN